MPSLSHLFTSKSRLSSSSGPPSPSSDGGPKSPRSSTSSPVSSRFVKQPPPPPPSYTRPIDWFDGAALSSSSKPSKPPSARTFSFKSRGRTASGGLSSPPPGPAGGEDGSSVVDKDPSLENWKWYLTARYRHFLDTLARISALDPRGLEGFCSAYQTMGLVINADNSITYTEWAEDIIGAALIGDFNDWNPTSHRLQYQPSAYSSSTGSAYWTVHLPANANGSLLIPIGSEIKVRLTLKTGETVDRFPAYTLRATQQQNPPEVQFRARMERMPDQYRGYRPPIPKTPRIYEAHIGAATSRDNNYVGTFEEFERDVLPRVKAGGYNTLQLFGVMEHPYYASYGYQVSSYYAVSSRFGSVESLISLIDACHNVGIRVILDVVHSHSCANPIESLNQFNGTDGMYFRQGKAGTHSIWGTRIFDYGKTEVLRFLLSNLHFAIDRLGFDGFRFDSVSSMLFKDHAIDRSFYGDYGDYFSSNTDHEGVEYLMLANHMLSTIFPFVTTIAEDFAGFPTLALPTHLGGVGFNYRLGLGNPDFWYHLLKQGQDDSKWKATDIVASLGNRRAPLGEKSIAFAESHDQCIEGGKTISHWLFDGDIYDNMSLLQPPTPRVQRGMALHKLIRLMTCAFAGEGYMNFMGNEFGHPEWLVFPSISNGFTSDHARRQWSLADPERSLRFSELAAFDKAMLRAEQQGGWGSGKLGHVYTQDDKTGLIVFLRASHLFLVNFHPTSTLRAGKWPVPEQWNEPGKYRVVLATDLGLMGTSVTETKRLDIAPRSALVVARFNSVGGLLNGQ